MTIAKSTLYPCTRFGQPRMCMLFQKIRILISQEFEFTWVKFVNQQKLASVINDQRSMINLKSVVYTRQTLSSVSYCVEWNTWLRWWGVLLSFLLIINYINNCKQKQDYNMMLFRPGWDPDKTTFNQWLCLGFKNFRRYLASSSPTAVFRGNGNTLKKAFSTICTNTNQKYGNEKWPVHSLQLRPNILWWKACCGQNIIDCAFAQISLHTAQTQKSIPCIGSTR